MSSSELDMTGNLSRSIAVVFVAMMVLLLPVYVWHEGTSGFLTDDAMHLMLADFFSPYYEGNVFVDHFVASRSRFPPAFPVLIGLFGGGSESMAIAHLVTAACFLLSAVLFYLWAHRTLQTADIALACFVCYALLPESLMYVIELRSEFLYMALAFGALILLSREHEQQTRETLIAAAFIIGLSLATRTVGAALFAAFLFYLLINRVPRKWLYVGIVAMVPAAWLAIKAINGYSGNYAEDLDQYLDGSGFSKLILEDIPRNAWLMIEGWEKHLNVEPNSAWYLHLAAYALLITALAGATKRIVEKRVDGIYLALYLPLILIWPHPFHITRLIYPIVPLLLVYSFIGMRCATTRLSGPSSRVVQVLAVMTLLSLTYPNVLFVIERFSDPTPAVVPEDFRHTRTWLTRDYSEKVRQNLEIKATVIDFLSSLKRHMRPNDCMYAVHPVSAMLYSNRPAVMVSSNPVAKRLRSCDYLFVMNLRGEYKAKFPLEKIDPDLLQLVDIAYDTQGEQQAYLFAIRR